MATFSDDFERPDGGLSNNWVTISGTPTITSGRVGGVATWSTRQTGISGSGRQEAITHFYYTVAADMAAGPVLKIATSGNGWYFFGATGTLAAPVWNIVRQNSNGTTQSILSVAGSALSAGTHVTRALWENNVCSLWVDGYFIGSVADNTWADNAYIALRATGASTGVESITAYFGEETQAFAVSPDVVGNYNGACTDVSFTGTDTDWLTSNPTFTVNHGSLTSIVITSDTTATASYCPGTFLGTATITDPTTGASDTLTVTSDPGVIPPPSTGWPNEGWQAVTNAAGTAHPTSLAITEATLIHATEAPELNLDIVQAIAEIWAGMYHFGALNSGNTLASIFLQLLQIIAGSENPTVTLYAAARTTSLREELEGVTDRLDLLTADQAQTLVTIRNAIMGDPPINLQDILAAISGVSAGSNDDVLAALAAYWGVDAPTILQLAQMVDAISTPAGYTLADVLDAISGISAPDLSAITAKLNAIQPNTDYTLTTLTSRMADLQNDMTAVLDQLDTIQALIENLPTAEAPTVAPVWPGVANVTLGAPVALTDQLVLEGPMHGVLVSVTTPPTRTGLRQIGGHLMDYGVGEVAFMADNGYIEPWVYMGFRTAIFTPKSMASADGALFRVLAGAGGTARTWVRS
jgi:hypothetical protein